MFSCNGTNWGYAARALIVLKSLNSTSYEWVFICPAPSGRKRRRCGSLFEHVFLGLVNLNPALGLTKVGWVLVVWKKKFRGTLLPAATIQLLRHIDGLYKKPKNKRYKYI